MPTEDQNLSEELEKLESISGKRTEIAFSCEDNPFQRRSKCNSRNATIWPAKCHCPYVRRSTRSTVPFKRHSGKILKQPTFRFPGYSSYHSPGEIKLGSPLPSDDLCVEEYDGGDEVLRPARCDSPFRRRQSLDSMSDVTIYELASYFEVLVDIPKQMSTMAEMMYM